MAFIRVCVVSDLEPGEVMSVDGPTEPIAVYNVNDRFFATQDLCTHGQWRLSESYVDGDIIECALHMACFSISGGKVLAPPASLPLKTYAVKVENDSVFVDPESGDFCEREGAV